MQRPGDIQRLMVGTAIDRFMVLRLLRGGRLQTLTAIPDELRGRVAGIELLSYGIGPTGGQFRAGAVASLTSVRVAVWSGGAACVVAVAAIYRLLPRFVGFHADAESPAAGRAILSRTL